MTKAYSNDLRERVVSAVLAGESCSIVAGRFGVAKSSAIKWTQRFKFTGSVAPAKMGGYERGFDCYTSECSDKEWQLIELIPPQRSELQCRRYR